MMAFEKKQNKGTGSNDTNNREQVCKFEVQDATAVIFNGNGIDRWRREGGKGNM